MKSGGEMLIAAPERWDEACYMVPAVRALLASGMSVGVACDEAQVGFWETVAGIKLVPFSKKSKGKVVASQITGHWQASLAWEPGLAAEAFKLAAIPRRLGPSVGKLGKWLTHPMRFAPGPQEHRVRHYLAAMEELGVETARPEFFAPADLGVERVSGSVLLCPCSDFGPNHEWPLERWLELAEKLTLAGRRMVIGKLEGGRGCGQALADRLGAESIPLTPSAGVMTVLAGFEFLIAADSSLPHLAAHVGVTCVTLFGPNDPAWKRPLGRRHAVVRRHVECAPCLLAKCPLDLRCQNELEVERVWQAVREKLELSSDGSG